MANFLNQVTTIIGLPAGCVGHDIHFTGYRGTNIIVLGKCSNHHICLRFRSGWCQDIPDSSSLERKMKVCNTNRRDDVARFSGMNYDSELQNMSWFCYNMWTRCPRQAWPHSSLIIKHYRVQVVNHHQGHRSPCALIDELLILEQINQWLGVLGYTYGMEVASLRTTEYFPRMHDWLGMIPEEATTSFLEFTAATCIDCMWT